MSLKTRIIPCLDVKDGRVVKGVQFESLRDAGDPAMLAELYDREGADELCFLDISASREARGTLLEAVRRTAEACFLPLTVGGGVRTPDDVSLLLRAGADKVAINTAAVADPELVAQASTRFGAQCITVAIDAKRVGGGWQVFTHGGSRPTGIDAIAFAGLVEENGAGEILLTSMDRDGVKSGYDLDLIRAVKARVRVPVIASGGAGNLSHLIEAARDAHADAVLAASIFHFGEVRVRQAKTAMAQAGIPIRLEQTL